MNILRLLRSRFEDALAGLCDNPAEFAAMVKPAQDAKFGDYQANCAMPLANQAKQKGKEVIARDVALQIVGKLNVAEFCEPPEIAGPGFINLKLKSAWLEAATNAQVADERVGIAAVAHAKTVVVDYSAPNVAKPMHVGHLRSSVIGDALYRIHKFLGHRVTGDNHIGDWGTQFGMIIYGYKHFLDKAAFEKQAVAELARLYRLVNQLSDFHEAAAGLPELRKKLAQAQELFKTAEGSPVPADKKEQENRKKNLRKLTTDVNEQREQVASSEKKIAAVESDPSLHALAQAHPRIAVLAREETAKLHAGDAENVALWNQFMPACLAAINAMYDRLGIHFDLELGESFYNPMLAGVVADLQKRAIAKESEGAICVFIPGVEAPFIVRKTDGAFTYATTDLATIKYRAETLHADTILYVVDARQSDHFKLLFETARRWGYEKVDFRHISFGTILGDDKRPFKTRSGDTVGLESLIDESVARARQIVEANDNSKSSGAELDETARQTIAEAVGIGAIKYADLCQNRETDYVFSWDKMLATTGDTATYMQYAYARICGIIRRGNVDREQLRKTGGVIRLAQPAERALGLQLTRFHEALDQAAAECRPNFLTQYLFETANCFSTFYDQCPVLKAETDELRTSRLLLADLTARVIARGLELLGIRTIEQM